MSCVAPHPMLNSTGMFNKSRKSTPTVQDFLEAR